LGNQTPTARDKTRKYQRISNEIRNHISEGEMEEAIELTVKIASVINPTLDLTTIVASTKAAEIIESGSENIKLLQEKKIISTTKLDFVTKESIKFAEETLSVSLSPGDRIILEKSLKTTLKIELEVKD